MSSGDASWIAQLNVSELREQLAGFGLVIAGPKHELADRLRTCLYSTASSSAASGQSITDGSSLAELAASSSSRGIQTGSAPSRHRAHQFRVARSHSRGVKT